MFLCFISSSLISPFHHYCQQSLCSLSPSPFASHYLSLCSLSSNPSIFILSLHPIPLSNLFHHSLFAFHSPISSPCLLHHSIFVLVQLQKWDLAVTNLLAKPPRAPCGGASSRRTRVIDWTWGKLCQAGHHDWISSLIINSLLPQVLQRDTSVMQRVFHDTWCPGLLGLIHISRLHFYYANSLFLFFPLFHVPDPIN